MRFLVFSILLFGVVRSPVAAHDCRAERQVFAKAACLEYAVSQEILAMDGLIVTTTSSLQAATAEELIDFEAGLGRAQKRWDLVASAACRESAGEDAVRFQTCRLAAAKSRRAQLETALADMRAEMGGAPALEVPVPDSVEVLVPLTVPGGGGPDKEVRVPFYLPVTPQ